MSMKKTSHCCCGFGKPKSVFHKLCDRKMIIAPVVYSTWSTTIQQDFLLLRLNFERAHLSFLLTFFLYWTPSSPLSVTWPENSSLPTPWTASCIVSSLLRKILRSRSAGKSMICLRPFSVSWEALQWNPTTALLRADRRIARLQRQFLLVLALQATFLKLPSFRAFLSLHCLLTAKPKGLQKSSKTTLGRRFWAQKT